MNLDKQLLVGIVMMSLGGFVALLAYTILREQQKAAKTKAKDKLKLDDAEMDDDDQTTEDKTEDTPLEQFKAQIILSLEKVKNWIVSRLQDTETPVSKENETAEIEEREPSDDAASATKKRIGVFTLLRDEEKGNLIVQVGDHEYHSSEDLHDSPDWNRVEHASADLSVWLSGAQEQALEPKPIKPDEHKPLNMVEQINQFLQRNLAEIEDEKRRIKLYEGPDESVHVLIDNNSYAIDEVPDSDVNELIRKAVSEWEALQ
jgi:hypothetical protein